MNGKPQLASSYGIKSTGGYLQYPGNAKLAEFRSLSSTLAPEMCQENRSTIINNEEDDESLPDD